LEWDKVIEGSLPEKVSLDIEIMAVVIELITEL
jgi:hypothetical protein